MPRWRLRDRSLEFPPPLAVGIVNVTDESFYAGARSRTPEQAVQDGLALVGEGFDLLDVGAVPAAAGPVVDRDEEAARLIPAVRGLAGATDVPITADTWSAEVAALALEAGATAINDISGSEDIGMLELVGRSGCGYVLTHARPPRADGSGVLTADPIARLKSWFAEALAKAGAAGVDPEQVAIDPGFDLGLSVEEGAEVLRRLSELRDLERPLFVAVSRKDFLGALMTGSWDERAPAEEREWGTAAATTLAVRGGAELLRLHDRSALDALRVATRVVYG